MRAQSTAALTQLPQLGLTSFSSIRSSARRADETAESHDNLLIHNTFKDNPLECGIVLGSHPPAGHASPPYATHYGVNNNTVAENVSAGNGVKIGGSGVGLFSDGNGSGTVAGNLIVRNTLIGNGLGGVALHSHVGPAFGLPPDNFYGNVIIGNFIAKNFADTADTATPGSVGININSGAGGTPVRGTVISYNVIRDEDVDIAVNTPGEVDIHLNDLGGDKIGVANVCAFDKARQSRNDSLGWPICIEWAAATSHPGATAVRAARHWHAPAAKIHPSAIEP